MGRFSDFFVATITLFTTFQKSHIRVKSLGLMTIAAALPLAAGLGGCGGGGGAGVPSEPSKEVPSAPISSPVLTPGSTPVVSDPTAAFTPNYRSDLTTTRHWDKAVVTVGFTPPAADSTGAVRNMAPDVQQAINLWNSKIGQDISYRMTTGSDADVQIQWVGAGSLPSDAIGRTVVQFRNADQVLFTASVSVDQTLPDAYQVQVITHELGHALGIEGHSLLSSDLMYVNSHLPATITTRDQNTVLQAYQGSRSLHPVVAGGTNFSATSVASAASSSVQYVCGSHEFFAKKH